MTGKKRQLDTLQKEEQCPIYEDIASEVIQEEQLYEKLRKLGYTHKLAISFISKQKLDRLFEKDKRGY